MRTILLLGTALLLAAGCSGPMAERVRVPMGTDLRSYKRLGVMPFGDNQGLGTAYSEEMIRGLWSLDFDVVSGDQLATTLREMKVRGGESVGPQDLFELRNRTRIDGLLFGSVDCRQKTVTVVLLDTAGSEPVFEQSFSPQKCGRREDVPVIVRHVVAAMRSRLKRAAIESIDDVPF